MTDTTSRCSYYLNQTKYVKGGGWKRRGGKGHLHTVVDNSNEHPGELYAKHKEM